MMETAWVKVVSNQNRFLVVIGFGSFNRKKINERGRTKKKETKQKKKNRKKEIKKG